MLRSLSLTSNRSVQGRAVARFATTADSDAKKPFKYHADDAAVIKTLEGRSLMKISDYSSEELKSVLLLCATPVRNAVRR